MPANLLFQKSSNAGRGPHHLLLWVKHIVATWDGRGRVLVAGSVNRGSGGHGELHAAHLGFGILQRKVRYFMRLCKAAFVSGACQAVP